MKGTVRQRSKGSWTLIYDVGRDPNGKRKQKWQTIRGTRQDAERELRRILRDLDTGAFVEPTKLTVAEYLDDWLSHARGNLSAKSYERYEEIVRLHLKPVLGHYPLVKLQPLHIKNFYAEALVSGRIDGTGGLTAQTVLHHHRVLHRALGQAVKLQLLARNPTDAVEPPRRHSNQIRVVSEGEVTQLLANIRSKRLYTPTILALTTGMRRGELMALKWQDVDLEAAQISVNRSLEQTNAGLQFKSPKSGRGRTVALPSIAVEALRAHRTCQLEERLLLGPGYADNDLVFALADGSPWAPDSFSSSFAAAMRRARLKHVSFHGLRHSHATLLLKQGVHPKIVSERLGHAKVGTTLDIYSHVIPGMQDEAAQRIDGALRSAIEASK